MTRAEWDLETIAGKAAANGIGPVYRRCSSCGGDLATGSKS